MYGFRVCPVRVTPTIGDVYGVYSLPVRHKVSLSTASPDVLTALSDQTDTVDGPIVAGQLRSSSSGLGHKMVGNGMSLSAMMVKCKRMSDQEKATAWAIVFVVGTIALALIVKLIMNVAA